jgi:hypothetical protein
VASRQAIINPVNFPSLWDVTNRLRVAAQLRHVFSNDLDRFRPDFDDFNDAPLHLAANGIFSGSYKPSHGDQ